MRRFVARVTVLLMAAAVTLAGCSPRRTAVRILGKALAEGTSVYATDRDPELVREALPFALKTIESLLASDPGNRDLALAACSGFAQYGYGFVLDDAERLRGDDREAAERARHRGVELLLRGRDHCLAGWAPPARGGAALAGLRRDPIAAAAALDDAALLYWTGAAWGGALSAGRERPELIADLPAIRAIFERLLVVEEDYDGGAAHEAMIALDAMPAMMGGSFERADAHYARALELSRGLRASTHLAWAQAVAVNRQDRRGFVDALSAALAIDVDEVPRWRLANLLSKRRAERLLARADDFFLEPLDESTDGSDTPQEAP